MGSDVVLVRTGVANVASVAAAFRRLGTTLTSTADPHVVHAARAVVLPGVGAFGAGISSLRKVGLDTALIERIESGRPTLAICLGMQLLARRSEETPGLAGLGVVPTDVSRLRGAPRLPHFGWNRVEPAQDSELLCTGEAYFAHTFRLNDGDALEAAGWRVAKSHEGERFVAAIEREGVLACQFHPELSGAWGASLLERWLVRAGLESAQEAV